MGLLLFRRFAALPSLVSPPSVLSRVCGFCSKSTAVVDSANSTNEELSHDNWQTHDRSYSGKVHVSPLLDNRRTHSFAYDIEVMDDDIWRVSSGLAHAWRGVDEEVNAVSAAEPYDEEVEGVVVSRDDPDFVEVDDMRIRGDLFYKLDRHSKEYEEYNFDFHRKKSSNRKDDIKASEKSASKDNANLKESKRDKLGHNSVPEAEKLQQIMKGQKAYTLLNSIGGCEHKTARTPTFNQLTAPYHEPFCLDIYISKASVRACIIHRVTSKVVAVAHSISKDIKFDLTSTRNPAACAAVGKILAQRALADDIHDAVYTPRKGERLEGKLQIVLQSIIDNGINVKVKLKQRKPKKTGLASTV